MASVALAGPPRVNDNLQTGPTVYKSGTLVEAPLRAFFCQSPDASLNPWLGLSRDISDPTTPRFAKRNRFRESFSNTQCLVCISDAFWKSVSPCHAYPPGKHVHTFLNHVRTLFRQCYSTYHAETCMYMSWNVYTCMYMVRTMMQNHRHVYTWYVHGMYILGYKHVRT